MHQFLTLIIVIHYFDNHANYGVAASIKIVCDNNLDH